MKEKIKKIFNLKKDASYFEEFGTTIEKKAPMFALFIKIMFVIIKWLFLLAIIIILVYVITQIDWSFFVYSKKSDKCMTNYSNYLFDKNKSTYIKDLSDDKLKEAAQIWGLDQGTLLQIKKEDTRKEQESFKNIENCRKFPPPAILQEASKTSFLNTFEISWSCAALYKLTLTYLGTLINESLKEGTHPTISDSLINELNSKGVCLRPAFFR